MQQTSNGIPILELEEIGSTNAEAMRLGLAGDAMPLWVRADRQISGRGRSGRAWTSEPGNLYASLLLRLTCSPTVLHHLSFVAAVAVVAAIRAAAPGSALTPSPLEGKNDPETQSVEAKAPSPVLRTSSPPVERSNPRTSEEFPSPLGEKVPEGRMRGPLAPQAQLSLRLKWPNDILVDGAKLVGILPESTLLPDKGVLAVIGVGINLAHAPGLPGRPTTCLATHGFDVSPPAMLDALAVAMAAAISTWDQGSGFSIIRDLWLADAGPLGAPMSVHAGRDKIDGTFAGLDHDGALILREHTGYHRRMTFGDVTLNTAEGGGGQ